MPQIPDENVWLLAGDVINEIHSVQLPVPYVAPREGKFRIEDDGVTVRMIHRIAGVDVCVATTDRRTPRSSG